MNGNTIKQIVNKLKMSAMACIHKINTILIRSSIFRCLPSSSSISLRSISISSANYLKEIRATETDKQIVIEGVPIKSDREGKVIDLGDRGGCPLCRVGLKSLKHTDILILAQFINSDGSVIPQHITGLCNRQQFAIVRSVALAQKAGLIPKKPGTPLFREYQKFNSYYKRF